MHKILPNQLIPVITQKPGETNKTELESREALIAVISDKNPLSAWRPIPQYRRLRDMLKKRKINQLYSQTRLNTQSNTAVYLASSPKKDSSCFEKLSFAGKLVKHAMADKPRNLTLYVADSSNTDSEILAKSLISALIAYQFKMPEYKSSKSQSPRLKKICIAGLKNRIDISRTIAVAEANNLARWLTALPPNKLDAENYVEAIKYLSKKNNWQFEFYNQEKLKQLNAGAFLAVSQGNPIPDAGIVRLSYRPKKNMPPEVALVGKGIIFDTGGTNLKPFRSMLDMHHDMAGSAVALATIQAITDLKAPIAVDCWLAITENLLSNQSYKSRDIVTASNGTKIEVIHTDAEGRMILADTLSLAGKEKPEVILDFATLTGSCVTAITDRYSGAFSNKNTLNELVIHAGVNSGARVWPFPLDKDFDEDLKSDIADVLQCSTGGSGDHIQAARFLKRFVPKSTPWIHLDLSSASRSGGLAHIPTSVTGFGVRFAIELLINHLDDLKSARGDSSG
ncbi:MAG: leucyl aminopeptidase family protein [Pseudomonadota bacterium]|nr:leucyl aminopeptidase family protein [Pseudomonadota bacterium]